MWRTTVKEALYQASINVYDNHLFTIRTTQALSFPSVGSSNLLHNDYLSNRARSCCECDRIYH